MKYLQSYYTDTGTSRKNNQDSLALFKADTDRGEVLLALLCDGMGGYQAGELASGMIVERFEQWFKQELPLILYHDFSWHRIRRQWQRIVYECNSRLMGYGRQKRMLLGSTLTACLFLDREYYCVHVGDSRAYRVCRDRALQITRDQSLVAEAVRRGEITAGQARTDRRRNMLLECVGVTPGVQVLFYTGQVSGGDSFTLCSDGFWHYVTEEEMTRCLWGGCLPDNKTIRTRLQMLSQAVMERGEKDNISVISVVPYGEV